MKQAYGYRGIEATGRKTGKTAFYLLYPGCDR